MSKNANNKTEKIELRISPADKELIQLSAVNIGTSVSKFIIATALGQDLLANKADRGIRKELLDIKQELNRIGNNLNQLTKNCQTSKQLRELVPVRIETIESTKKTIARGIESIDRYLLNQINKNLL